MGCQCRSVQRIARDFRFLWYINKCTWKGLGEENASALATGFGFNDKRLCLSPPARLVIIGSEQCGVRGKEEGLRDVAVVFWVVILHFDQGYFCERACSCRENGWFFGGTAACWATSQWWRSRSTWGPSSWGPFRWRCDSLNRSRPAQLLSIGCRWGWRWWVYACACAAWCWWWEIRCSCLRRPRAAGNAALIFIERIN